MSSRNLNDCEPNLAIRFRCLEREFKQKTGNDLMITCTLRTPEEQFLLFKKGRELRGEQWVLINPKEWLTDKDGINHKSEHNYIPARALDVAVIINGKVSWNEDHYIPLIEISKNHGLESGGSWSDKKRDFPHIQLP